MTGAYFGSLAASASVFVAILTALLVNSYVRIKSDRRQTKRELNRVKEELHGLRDRRDDYQQIVGELVEKRESNYRKKAEERVDEFISNEVPDNISQPIENITLSGLYQKLIEFHNCESHENLEHSTENLHHREVLEERVDEIKEEVLLDIVYSFANDYRGEGFDTGDSEYTKKLIEKRQNEDGEKASPETDLDINVESEFSDSLSLEEFIGKYQEKYSLDQLDQETIELLEYHYDELVDQNPLENLNSSLDIMMGDKTIAPSLFASMSDSMFSTPDFDISRKQEIIGLNVQEQRELDEAEKNTRDIQNQISILENRKERLEREKDGLHPEDLNSTLYANILTIFLSVVIPVIAYLDLLTSFTVPQLHFINVYIITLCWLLGLVIVFVSIRLEINDESWKDYV